MLGRPRGASDCLELDRTVGDLGKRLRVRLELVGEFRQSRGECRVLVQFREERAYGMAHSQLGFRFQRPEPSREHWRMGIEVTVVHVEHAVPVAFAL